MARPQRWADGACCVSLTCIILTIVPATSIRTTKFSPTSISPPPRPSRAPQLPVSAHHLLRCLPRSSRLRLSFLSLTPLTKFPSSASEYTSPRLPSVSILVLLLYALAIVTSTPHSSIAMKPKWGRRHVNLASRARSSS